MTLLCNQVDQVADDDDGGGGGGGGGVTKMTRK